ncbi:uncharacterized protein [Watersipora subatra]|uniref:uncharacterized protein n=1 Tax=Watersipora subatra TaxID=2589382 RepID=UPI00355AF35F
MVFLRYGFLVLAGLISLTYGDCTMDGKTGHFWQRSNPPFNYIKVRNSNQPRLQFYNFLEHEKFWHTTKLFDCGASYHQMLTRAHYVTPSRRPLYNHGGNVRLTNTNSPPANSGDSRLFRYHNGGGSMEFTSMRSALAPNKYVKHGGINLIFSPSQYYWITLPYVTLGLSSHPAKRAVSSRKTRLLSSLTINNVDTKVAVTVRNQRRLLLRKVRGRQIPNSRLEVLIYRLYKRVKPDGSLDIGKAVVLKANAMNFLALKLNAEDEIDLPLTNSSRQETSFDFNKVNLERYNDVLLNRTSILHSANVQDQNVVDERFFEVLEQSDGNIRLVSTLHPNRYLAVYNDGGNPRLIVAELSSLPNSVINYNFQMTPLPEDPVSVLRLPNFPACNLTPINMYTVADQPCSTFQEASANDTAAPRRIA